MVKKIFTILFVLAAGFAVYLLLSGAQHDEHSKHDHSKHGHEKKTHKEPGQFVKMTAEEMQEFGITTAAAGPGNLQFKITLTGEIVINNDKKAHIMPIVSGIVRQVNKNIGDSVHKGELLAVIRSRELANLTAEYLSAKKLLILARARYNREKRLWKKKITAEKDYLQAKQSLEEVSIRLRSKEHKLRAIGFTGAQLLQLSDKNKHDFTLYRLNAPFLGTVIKKHITVGENVKSDTAVFEIADTRSVWVDFNIYQKHIPYVYKGSGVHVVSGSAGLKTWGRIIYISPVADERSRTIKGRVLLDNSSGKWRPGLFVTGKIVSRKVWVPVSVQSSALQILDRRPCVFVRVKGGFKPRFVKIGRKSDTHVEVKLGLSAGEQYAAKGGFTLKAELSKSSFGDGHNH